MIVPFGNCLPGTELLQSPFMTELAWDHFHSIITDSCGVVADPCCIIANPCSDWLSLMVIRDSAGEALISILGTAVTPAQILLPHC